MTTLRNAHREMLIEQLMTLIGRGQPNPVAYRRELEAMDAEELQKLLDEALGETE